MKTDDAPKWEGIKPFPTCDTCKWWKETDAEQLQYHPETLARIRNTEITTRRCHNQKLFGTTDSSGALVDETTATPDASDSCGLMFLTGSKFGCIHHENPE